MRWKRILAACGGVLLGLIGRAVAQAPGAPIFQGHLDHAKHLQATLGTGAAAK
jgi:hypothetical protein